MISKVIKDSELAEKYGFRPTMSNRAYGNYQSYTRNKSLDSKSAIQSQISNPNDYINLNQDNNILNTGAKEKAFDNRNLSVPKLNFNLFDVNKGSKSTRREINSFSVGRFNSVETNQYKLPYHDASSIRIYWPNFVNNF